MNYSYNVDCVICIDGTASMAPGIESVKANVLSLYERISDNLEEKGWDSYRIRLKIIVFRNYGFDDEPMTVSDFYTLPEQREEFNSFVNGIEAKGGDGGPSNALEAIALALKSEWTTEGTRKRHGVFVFTDKTALPLGERAGNAGYPADMPKTLDEFCGWWEGTLNAPASRFNFKVGRLVVFAPSVYPWENMNTWNRYWPVYAKEGIDLSSDCIYDVIDYFIGDIW